MSSEHAHRIWQFCTHWNKDIQSQNCLGDRFLIKIKLGYLQILPGQPESCTHIYLLNFIDMINEGLI